MKPKRRFKVLNNICAIFASYFIIKKKKLKKFSEKLKTNVSSLLCAIIIMIYVQTIMTK